MTQSWLDETHFEIPPAPLLEHAFNRTCCSHAEPVIVFTNQDATEFEEVSDDLIILQGRGNLADSDNLWQLFKIPSKGAQNGTGVYRQIAKPCPNRLLDLVIQRRINQTGHDYGFRYNRQIYKYEDFSPKL